MCCPTRLRRERVVSRAAPRISRSCASCSAASPGIRLNWTQDNTIPLARQTRVDGSEVARVRWALRHTVVPDGRVCWYPVQSRLQSTPVFPYDDRPSATSARSSEAVATSIWNQNKPAGFGAEVAFRTLRLALRPAGGNPPTGDSGCCVRRSCGSPRATTQKRVDVASGGGGRGNYGGWVSRVSGGRVAGFGGWIRTGSVGATSNEGAPRVRGVGRRICSPSRVGLIRREHRNSWF